MNDLIERKAAIDAVYKCDDIFAGDMPVMVVKADAYEALAQLPPAQPKKRTEERTETHACDCISRSAQPERLTDDDFETIRIHLNAYKEKLCNQHRWEEADEYQRIIDRFMAFASAQTEIVQCKDCKYWNPYRMECEGIGNWFGFEGAWEENGYCYKAERREDA